MHRLALGIVGVLFIGLACQHSPPTAQTLLEGVDDTALFVEAKRRCLLNQMLGCLTQAQMTEWGRGTEADAAEAKRLFTTICGTETPDAGVNACAQLRRLERLEEVACQSDVPDGTESDGGSADGGLDRSAILHVVKAHEGAIKNCYERSLSERHAPEGTVKMAFTIRPNGRIKSVTALESIANEPVLDHCISDEIRRWRFPCPAGGGVVNVTFPWVFSVEPADAGRSRR